MRDTQMKYLDLTFSTPHKNLACDEALLDLCEEGGGDELLRFWEPRDYFVVLGYANKAHSEANLEACRKANLPVLRRCTGGGTVVQGPGCLNYSLFLRISATGLLQSITKTNCFIMKRQRETLQNTFGRQVEVQGVTDLTIDGLKFSGNAQRRRREFLLFHGTFLLDLNLDLIEKLLPMPSKQPDYRNNRQHIEFLTNLTVPASAIKQCLARAWNATEPAEPLPNDRIDELVREKYSKQEWNLKF
ncbi:MAG: lipoate--protein ligase family protein [Verrucomicrobiota bacterium]